MVSIVQCRGLFRPNEMEGDDVEQAERSER